MNYLFILFLYSQNKNTEIVIIKCECKENSSRFDQIGSRSRFTSHCRIECLTCKCPEESKAYHFISLISWEMWPFLVFTFIFKSWPASYTQTSVYRFFLSCFGLPLASIIITKETKKKNKQTSTHFGSVLLWVRCFVVWFYFYFVIFNCNR